MKDSPGTGLTADISEEPSTASGRPELRRPGRPAEVSPNLIPLLRNPGNQPSMRQVSTRRPPLIAFVTDAATERALNDGLAEITPVEMDIRRGGIRAAIPAMQTAITPRVLIVDISGDDQPLASLMHLANVVEPDVHVLVIGETDSIDLYREITKNLGAYDYLRKPLTNDKVVHVMGPLVAGHARVTGEIQGGSLVIFTGVRGGAGATTLAVNLAGHLGVTMRRHTVLLDPDLHLGDASFQLNVKPGPGLRVALEAPERIDALLAERAAQPAADRLHVLSGEELLINKLNYAPGGVASLLTALRWRYNFIIADLPFSSEPLYDELLKQAHQRVLVMSPTLSSVRAALRLLAASPKSELTKRPVMVLNRAGTPGSLTRRQMEEALAMKIDVVIPDQPRQVAAAATMGELAMAGKNGIRSGIQTLARHVDTVGLLHSPASGGGVQQETGARLPWRLFRRKI
jgi:pilus assembly protein CpaE